MAAQHAGGKPAAQARVAPAQPVAARVLWLGLGQFLGRSVGMIFHHAGIGRGAERRRHDFTAPGEARIVIGQAQPQRDQHEQGEHRKGRERTDQAQAGNDQQRRQRRPQHRAQAEARCHQRQRLRALFRAGAASDVGLHRRRGGRSEHAVERTGGGEDQDGGGAAEHAVQAGEQRQPAQRERQREGRHAQRHHRLAAASVRAARPVGRHQHPQQRGPGIGEADPHVGDAQVRADRRHHRLHRGVARRGDQHDREQQRHAFRRQVVFLVHRVSAPSPSRPPTRPQARFRPFLRPSDRCFPPISPYLVRSFAVRCLSRLAMTRQICDARLTGQFRKRDPASI